MRPTSYWGPGALLLVVIAFAALAPLSPTRALGADGTAQVLRGDWALLQFEVQGVDPGAVATFRSLLQNELGARTGVVLLRLPDKCGDHRCAAAAAQSAGAEVALFGTIGALGQKIVFAVTTVLADSGEILSNVNLALDRLEDLDTAAKRIARAVAEGRTIDESAALGDRTPAAEPLDRRRHGDSGVALRIGGLVPFGTGFNGAGVGLHFDVAYWYEAPFFAIEPRVGVRFSGENRDGNRYVQVPLDVGAHYILGLGNIAPFLGAGLGARFQWSRRPATVLVGEVLQTRHEVEVTDSAWGVGLFARAGVMFFRTYSVRLALSADYDVTFARLHGGDYPMSLVFGLAVIF